MNAALIDGAERPKMIDLGLEVPRALGEYGLFLLAEPLLRAARSGDRHPVLVLPGFLGDDFSTLALRWHLDRLGYDSHGWRLGRNVGPTTAVIHGLSTVLDELSERDSRTVSLIGWSLGGVYAREMARVRPERVRQVITLGSPFRLTDIRQTRTERVYLHYRDRYDEAYRGPTYEYADEPLHVPSTAIYSRSDGIVAWQTCVQPVGPVSENIEVRGSHFGLSHNPAVVYALSDRLAQAEGEWRPFAPASRLRRFYPEAVDG